MPITFGGINTGLPPNLVDQLVEAERLPVKTLQTRKAKTENRLKLVEELDGKLRAIGDSLKELASTKGFSSLKLISGDNNVVQGTVDPGSAANGNWNIEVIRLANKASAVSNGFPDKDKTELGVGYFRFDTPEGTKEVYINGDNNTLEGAAKAINNAGIGIQATVINDRKDPDAPYRLVVSGASVGGDQGIKYPKLYFLDGDQDLYFDEEKPAMNGLIKVDGFEIEISDNTLNDIIPGVTVELKQATPGRSVNVMVKEDTEVVSGKIKTYVDALNGALSFVQQQNAINEKTDTSQTLGGDGMIRNVEQQLNRLVQNPQFGVSGSINRLGQLSVAFNRKGTLDFDQDKFNAVLGRQPDDVRKFFVGDGFTVGLIPTTRRLVQSLTDNNFGAIGNRKSGLRQQIQQADKRIEAMEARLLQRERSLRNQFASLEDKMSKIKSQGAMLQARLGGPGAGDFNLGGMSGGPGKGSGS